MARAPFQVLVFPYRFDRHGHPQYAIFRRADLGAWQGIAGGGEDAEMPEQAAHREVEEEAGLQVDAPLLRLDAVALIPAVHFAAATEWGPSIQEIPEYTFGVEAAEGLIELTSEHTGVVWLSYADASARLEWESNRIALRELHGLLTAGSE